LIARVLAPAFEQGLAYVPPQLPLFGGCAFDLGPRARWSGATTRRQRVSDGTEVAG